MLEISKRIQNIASSQTIAVDSKAKQLICEGKKIYNFAVGEPDIAPPEVLIKAIDKAYHEGKTKYTHPAGTPEVREKVAAHLYGLDKVKYSKDQIVVTNGGKQALFLAFQSIINEGDEVIILKPYWVSYTEQVKLAQGKPVFVDTTDEFQLDIEAIKEALTNKTKAIILNSPSNPTGMVFKKDSIKKLAAELEGKDIYIISDDIYQNLSYDEEFYPIAKYSKKIKEQTIIIQGLSKSHAMTGLRLGFMAANLEVTAAATKLQSQLSSNPNSLLQAASIEVMENSEEYEKKYFELFKSRRDLVVSILEKNDKISFNKPQGAFYVFVNISQIENDSAKFSEKLLEEELVATVPGIAFGMEGFVRLSFASSEKDLKEGLSKFNAFCEKIAK
ncbi:pyridoxal phosphate-dependent aminotransferase [Patescibacteria group bacterium]|nr:pyridoxal phosphate-dependent aminotransferase [Patescibacteria group bacterium]